MNGRTNKESAMKSLTEQWLEKTGATPEQARAMGLAPDQRRERLLRAPAIFARYGHQNTADGRAFTHAAKKAQEAK
jgi:hypothetical protein